MFPLLCWLITKYMIGNVFSINQLVGKPEGDVNKLILWVVEKKVYLIVLCNCFCYFERPPEPESNLSIKSSDIQFLKQDSR